MQLRVATTRRIRQPEQMINARSETAATMPAFRDALKCRRCVRGSAGGILVPLRYEALSDKRQLAQWLLRMLADVLTGSAHGNVIAEVAVLFTETVSKCSLDDLLIPRQW